ncbi:MAG: oxidoreductase, partial [Pedobacter sp.]|nr:oxidoreductase [Pedobacter sp.]
MKIVCLGSGNVASHLTAAFKGAGMEIVQVWSRNLSHADTLAASLNTQAIADLKLVDKNADLYLIAVKDDAIKDVAFSLFGVQGLVVHTSGATSIDVLKGLAQYGVLYPLQTFSKHKDLNLSGTPFCLEASSEEGFNLMQQLGSAIGAAIYRIDSEQRKILHLAAVFACNFSNHLYHLANTVLASNNLKFDLLRPLIMETALKVQHDVPIKVQTGPAVR